jgi:MATE family multidrug resistance protein
MSQTWRQQLPRTIGLAWPVVLGQLGNMTMTLVDSFMVGKLGPAALGGVGVGSAIFWAFASFGLGSLLGLDFLVARAKGRGAHHEMHEWLVQGLWFAAILAVPGVAGMHLIAGLLQPYGGFDPEVARSADVFLRAVSWSFPGFLVFVAFRQYLQAMESVRAANLILILANLVNAGLNWVFIYGHGGFPAMGVVGSGVSTALTRSLCALSVVIYALARDRRLGLGLPAVRWRPRRDGILELARLGVPAGLQMELEVVVFSLSTLLVGRLGAIPLAAHTVVLNIVSFTFMVPLGIGAAAAVQVGQAVGRRDPQEARLAGAISLALGGISMAIFGLAFLAAGRSVIALFSPDPLVIELGWKILLMGAVFQVADGLQTVGTGVLRGHGDTRTPMLANLFGYWMIGVPVGCYLLLRSDLGAVGLWAGLALGLWGVAAVNTARWRQVSRGKIGECVPERSSP